MIIQLQFSEIMGCANLFQRFLTVAVYCVSTPSILLTRVRTQRDLACAQMKFHKHMRDLLRFKAYMYFQFNNIFYTFSNFFYSNLHRKPS
jgi:hypothetical protein